MATWPTIAEIKTAYGKLNNSALDDRLTRARARAVAEITARCADLYDVSTWTTTAPPVLIELAYAMAYGFMSYAVHSGQQVAPGDQVGMDVLKEAREELKLYAGGQAVLVDSSGNVIAQRTFANGVTILEEPIFGLRTPPTFGIDGNSTGEAYGLTNT